MGELLAEWPSAGLTLFARYGVGGREKLGFRPEQRLRQVLSRYLVFDVEAVLQRLHQSELEQRQFRLAPAQFARALGEAALVDCRSPEEFRLGTLPGARLLDARLAAEVRGQRVLLFDQRGPMAGAAAVHLAAKLGCQPQVLDGGLLAWSEQIQPAYPVVGGRRSRILADWKQARFRCAPVSEPLEGDPALVPFECLRLWRSRDYLAVLRSSSDDWPALTPLIQAWDIEKHPWRPQTRGDWTERVRQVLKEDVQPDLQSHKGVVFLKEMREGVAHIELGGGCQGCSSAAITVGQEIAAALWRRIPELEGVEDASAHEDPSAQPHH
ncbi:MAG: NifU family protein [Candidatus Eremiobacteraeota bacterium]|nr:NifU family protein [Candidatus Eremiobacteraeota bacterium]MCW5869197.1 NifU family protein [Candidatus Eremiobacteraeota bacterium]